MTEKKNMLVDEINVAKLQKGLYSLSKRERSELIGKFENMLVRYQTSSTVGQNADLIPFFQHLSALTNCAEVASMLDPSVYYQFGQKLKDSADEQMIDYYLEIFRSVNFLKKIYDDSKWADLILDLLQISNHHFSKLFYRRAARYNDKILFSVIESNQVKNFSWQTIAIQVTQYAKGLLSVIDSDDSEEKVAFFCKNSIEMVLSDLACLSNGIINVMIPANSVPEHIKYILQKTKPSILFISDGNMLKKIDVIIEECHFIKAVVLYNDLPQEQGKFLPVEDLLKKGAGVPERELEKRRAKVRFDDLATIMFTSATTGNPKGIQFSHQNIVFKRFARAMALPEIGENDVFLAYLPLFHTFGRWLEMTGSIFWGARYVFMENPAAEIMIANMQKVQPTIFISIPKKWYQLYETIEQHIDLLKASDTEIKNTVADITGTKLKWGLSAAGYLDVEIFQFFQRYGIELMSGFGMTEATGGITMTPPGKYKPDSLGRALPGIELKLAEDGELWIKGGYVMMGYVNPEESDVTMKDGWLPTGDIMQIDEDAFIKIIDRKKEIYKNVKGETIAPQKIENYFRDFDFIRHVFLVGDHRPYNTLLIYPNYDFSAVDFKQMSADDIRHYFSSVIVSVNRFLASYERIVDFTIIDRDFSAEKGELTPKGTYKRKIVEKNFASFIKPMYQRNYYHVPFGEIEIRIPNWFLREEGITPDQVDIRNNELFLNETDHGLRLDLSDHLFQVGDFTYQLEGKILDFGKLLTVPQLSLGNHSLIEFTNEKIFKWLRNDVFPDNITYLKYTNESQVQDEKMLSRWYDQQKQKDINFKALHYAALLFNQADDDLGVQLIDFMGKALKERDVEISTATGLVLRRLLGDSSVKHRKELLFLLFTSPWDVETKIFLFSFFDRNPLILDAEIIDRICKLTLDYSKLEILFEITKEYCQACHPISIKLYRLLSRYGATHPTRYKIVRQFLVNCQLQNFNKRFKNAARIARFHCREGFRKWLGTTQNVAVDIETEEEYKWEDVITFEESIEQSDRDRLLAAIMNTTLLREAVFLFSKGVLVRLNDIPPGGVWISLLGKEHGKAVYRITIQTRFQGSFDLAVNLNHTLSLKQILEEINWLIQSGTAASDVKLVEDFGGYWDEYDLWSEEFIQGETAGKFISRIARQNDEVMNERVRQIWPYFIWGGVNTYVRFWMRTKKKLELSDPSPLNIIIPLHDYQTGSRIVSISARHNHIDSLHMVNNFYNSYIRETEEAYPVLKGIGKIKYVFSAIIEALGEEEGLDFLRDSLSLLKKKKAASVANLSKELDQYISSIKMNGFIPKRLYFAIKRYHRWQKLNPQATELARATTLSELYQTYELNLLEVEYPETRTKFFLHTVFAGSSGVLKQNLKKIISEQRNGQLSDDRITQHLSMLQKSIKFTKDELFFLARLSYPHLQPTDRVDFISLEKGGVLHTDLVVQSKDYEGNSFAIRRPVSPKEISRLYQLFISNKLHVQFRPDHSYLIAINDRNQLIGGLFYFEIEKGTVHLEKVVVDQYYRKKGVSDGILNEFFKRLRNDHVSYVTTGFFRPEYFYRFGFKIERKYAGLVKDLKVPEDEKSSVFEKAD